MEFTDEQKQTIAGWLNNGVALAEIQRKLESEFGAQLTYMEVRFLVDDLDLDIVDKEEPKPKEPADAADIPAVDAEADLLDDGPMGGSGVSVDIDGITRPGAALSGSVTFSDGEKMGWQLDTYGQLGLLPGKTEGYRPSEDDIMAFQRELEIAVRKKGMM